ncbi:serine/threonine-protein kinase PLK4-like isoform X2 [Babylonia areolata]|uniref:serine/threonine-protein kinase PLK4-like isoform X2 n=1 Tax=Babylonia areolata TaxID=304850 RepID=UPI003FD0371B
MSLNDYQVLNLLGKGGFACVYRARSNKTGQEVAIKMIDKKLMKAAGMVARVKKEVEIHSRLKHPSILELYNYFEDTNYVYLVLEIAHNGEFQRYLRTQNRVLMEKEARKVMKQVVEGMLYLHTHGILHRDLTLSNLLLTKDMNTKIADFGLATQLTEPEEKHFTMCGTPNYISPEVAMRLAHGLEADVWSLGCMLYTMLVGQPPFDTDAVRSTLNRVIQAEYDLPSDLSTEARDLIQCLLRKNPKQRLQINDVLSHPFMTKKPFVASTKIAQAPEMSMDSGRGTIATVSSTRSSSSSRRHPMPAFPIQEDEELSGCSGDDGAQSRQWPGGGHRHAHPPSPPVRDRESVPGSDRTAQNGPRSAAIAQQPLQTGLRKAVSYDSSLHKGHTDSKQHQGHREASASKALCNGAGGQAVFDPQRYQEHAGTPSSSSWSFSASSIHSAGNEHGVDGTSGDAAHHPHLHSKDGHRDLHHHHQHMGQQSQGCESGFSSQEEFSLQATRRVLDFESESLQNSLHDKTPVGGGGGGGAAKDMPPPNFQTQELLHKVQAYLGQCESPAARKSSRGKTAVALPDGSVEFGTPERTGKVCLTEQEVTQCERDDVVDSSSPQHSSDEDKKRGASKEGSQQDPGRPKEPLSTQRLRPIRQKTKNAVVNILESGEVCMEFVKNKGREERVVEVFSISSDGQQIIVFHPGDGGRGVAIGEAPPSPPSSCKTFTFRTLPDKYFKKYQYAAKFVGLVRSKTPKVTMYTERAKCMLMENQPSPDFEAIFYDGGKLSVTAKGVRIVEKTGTSLILDSAMSSQRLCHDTQELVDYTEKCRQQCIQLDSVISAVQGNGLLKEQLFPVIVGRRPNSGTDSSSKGSSSAGSTQHLHVVDDSGGGHPTSLPGRSSPVVPSFNSTLVTLVTDADSPLGFQGNSTLDNTLLSAVTTTSSENSTALRAPVSREVVQHIFVQDIGWASQLANGEIWVKFVDGTQLGMKSSATTITYIDTAGKVTKFQKSHMLPEVVKVRLEKLPIVLENLRTRSVAGSTVSAPSSV